MNIARLLLISEWDTMFVHVTEKTPAKFCVFLKPGRLQGFTLVQKDNALSLLQRHLSPSAAWDV